MVHLQQQVPVVVGDEPECRKTSRITGTTKRASGRPINALLVSPPPPPRLYYAAWQSAYASSVVADTGQEAQLYVPRLLSVLGSSKTAQHCFTQVWSSVPLHVLLPWAAQMLSLLDAPQGEALLPALQVGSLVNNNGLHHHSDASTEWLQCLLVRANLTSFCSPGWLTCNSTASNKQ